MSSTRIYSNECKFCARYLKDNGVSGDNFDEVVALITELDPDYKLIKIEKPDFFKDLATRLRDLWPAGSKIVQNKDGSYTEYPWRDSVTNLTRRLQLLWQQRELKNYFLEDCLSAARKYLAQFEQSTKYMKILKYFIFKQKGIVKEDGKITYVNESTFADMLEGKSELSAELDWTIGEDDTIPGTIEEGELI